jgi:hypothetical protein
MYKSQVFIKKQLAVIEDLFATELDEAEILKKHGVKPAVYRKWLADEQFAKQFEARMAQAYGSGRILLARHATKAAIRLIGLTECDQKETARKACLDIIFPPQLSHADRSASGQSPATDESIHSAVLSPETAGRILAILAEKPSGPMQEQEGCLCNVS